MSTVLTKPVLLDETGQAIVSKLDDIKSVIGTTGEFIPVMIKITTPPIKTVYESGEALDLTGIVVELFGNNGTTFDITEQCVFSPANGTILSSANTSLTVSYEWYRDGTIFTASQTLIVKTITAIAVTTPPTKTSYYPGDELDLTGIVVTATFDNGTTEIVTSRCEFSPEDGDTLSMEDTQVLITLTQGSTTLSAQQEITVSYPIYGVEWDGLSGSAFTRTDASAAFVDPVPSMSDGNGGFTDGSSPFDDIYPWSEIERTDAFSQECGTLVKIPKYYYKWTRNGSAMKLQISRGQFPGSHVSPAHQKRPNGFQETDTVYVGAYHCISSSYKSVASGTPISNVSMDEYDGPQNIRNLGSTIWEYDFAMFWTIAMLYLVEFADWNSQAKIGFGGAAKEVQNKLDSMTYHTGTSGTTLAQQSHVRYRWIEDLWANVRDYVNGIGLNPAQTQVIDGVRCVRVVAKLNLDVAETNIGWVPQTNNNDRYGVIQTWTVPDVDPSDAAIYGDFEYALFPSGPEPSGTPDYDTYCCDAKNSQSGNYQGKYITMGSGGTAKTGGLFSIYNYRYSTAQSAVGFRLMKLPNTP